MAKIGLLAFLLLGLAPAASGTTLRTRKRGDDDGDDGGAGGLAGALTGLMGGGGLGGGAGADDDEDPNMVGEKKKGGAKPGGAVDLSGLENSLKTGGVGGLMGMLTAMRAGMGHQSETHIKIGKDGEEMYDFRDLDDGLTTMAPITVTPPPHPTLDPKLIIPAVPVPEAPKLPMPPQILMGGKSNGIQAAKALAAAASKSSASARAASQVAESNVKKLVAQVAEVKKSHGKHAKKKGHKKLVVWGSRDAPEQPPAQPLPPAQQTPPVAPLPVVQQAAPVAISQSVTAFSPSVPTAQIGTGTAASGQGLFQGLAALRQNLDMLMGQAVQQEKSQSNSNNAAMEAKLDQLTKTVTGDEQKMEKRLDEQAEEMKSLEEQNSAMKKQLEEQAKEMKKVESAAAAQMKKIEAEAAKARTQPAAPAKPEATENKAPTVQAKPAVTESKTVTQLRGQATKTSIPSKLAVTPKSQSVVPTAPAYATKPWDATFRVHLDGKSEGAEESFTVRVHPEWAPEGAKRFQDLVQEGVFNDARFFRVVPNFMAQFGIPGSPTVAAKWVKKRIADDEVKQTNARGTMTFAKSGPNTRTSQIFINYANNNFLDQQGFAPFAEVLGDGMNVVDKVQSEYREKPNQGKIQRRGNSYLMKHFPELSFIGHVDSSLASPASFIQSTAPATAAPAVEKKADAPAAGNGNEVQHEDKKASASLAQASGSQEQAQEEQQQQQQQQRDEGDVEDDRDEDSDSGSEEDY